MARTIKAKRKQVKRRNATKSALPKILIGAGVLGGGYLLYTKVIKPYLQAGKDTTDLTTNTESAINTTVNAANNTTANVPSQSIAAKFSPIGTPVANLKLEEPITYGSKGEEVKQMQTVLNAVRNLYIKYGNTAPWKTVSMDGDFGKNTWEVHKLISYNAQPLSKWLKWYKAMENQIAFAKSIGGYSSGSSSSGGSAGFTDYGGVR